MFKPLETTAEQKIADLVIESVKANRLALSLPVETQTKSRNDFILKEIMSLIEGDDENINRDKIFDIVSKSKSIITIEQFVENVLSIAQSNKEHNLDEQLVRQLVKESCCEAKFDELDELNEALRLSTIGLDLLFKSMEAKETHDV